MALVTRNETIDDHPVTCTPHRARRAAQLLARLLRYIGPVLEGLRGRNAADLLKADIADFGPAIAALFEKLTPTEFDALAVEILAGCTISLPDATGNLKLYDLGKPDQIDAAFTGELKLMFKALAFALTTNFGNFFDGLGQSAGDAAPAATPGHP